MNEPNSGSVEHAAPSRQKVGPYFLTKKVSDILLFSVVVPTWKRPEKLARCLASLAAQTLAPLEVIVTYRAEDSESLEVLRSFKGQLPLVPVEVDRIGVIHAENAAMERVRGTVTAFIDDDAEAPPDWLERMSRHFSSDAAVVAVGGPDRIASQPETYEVSAERVGRLTWYGKVIGNHHRRTDGLRDVQVLKGVNMAFRTDALVPLDERLQGEESRYGNGSHWELDLCLAVARRGGRMVYDPALRVEHDSNHSHFVADRVARNNAHNLTYVLLKHLPLHRKVVFLTYSLAVGNTQVRGALKTGLDLIRERSFAPVRTSYHSLKGFIGGIGTYLRRKAG